MAEPPAYDSAALASSATRVRVLIAAAEILAAGEPLLTVTVVERAGLSRQALSRHHAEAARFLRHLRDVASRRSQSDTGIGAPTDLADARRALADERRRRRQAETDRNRALHHLELAEGTIRALRDVSGEVVPLYRR